MQKKLSKFDQFGRLWDFGHIFTNFSAQLTFFQFLYFQLTLCALCGHFEYNKPIFYDNFFLGPKGGLGLKCGEVGGYSWHFLNFSFQPSVFVLFLMKIQFCFILQSRILLFCYHPQLNGATLSPGQLQIAYPFLLIVQKE